MPVQINEVIVRAIITGDNSSQQATDSSNETSTSIATVTKDELHELIVEIIKDKKER